MRSLFYVIDRCKLKSFEKWDRCRSDPHPEEEDNYERDAKFYTERDFRACARKGKKDFLKFWSEWRQYLRANNEQPTTNSARCAKT